MARGRAVGTASVAGVLCAASAQDAAGEECADSSDVGHLCGVDDPEALIRLEGSRLVLVGNMGGRESQGGECYSADAATRQVKVVRLDVAGPASEAYRTCPGPPDPALRATAVFELDGDERFGAGTSAIVVGDERRSGSVRAKRLLRGRRPALAAPIGTETNRDTPHLRLVRMCSRGRRPAELRGDLERVREVLSRSLPRCSAR